MGTKHDQSGSDVVAKWAKRKGPFIVYRGGQNTAGIAYSAGFTMTGTIGSAEEVAALVALLNTLGEHTDPGELTAAVGVVPAKNPANLVSPPVDDFDDFGLLLIMRKQAEALLAIERACEADGDPPSPVGLLARYILKLLDLLMEKEGKDSE